MKTLFNTKIYLVLFLLLTSGCYTSIQVRNPQPQITHLLAVDSKGDTVRVQPHDFRLLYDRNPTYYSGWKIYHRNIWITPYSYYRYYYRPYQPRYAYYTPYTPPIVKKDSKTQQPRVNTPSQPRSSGTSTQQRTRNNESNRTSSTRRTRNQ